MHRVSLGDSSIGFPPLGSCNLVASSRHLFDAPGIPQRQHERKQYNLIQLTFCTAFLTLPLPLALDFVTPLGFFPSSFFALLALSAALTLSVVDSVPAAVFFLVAATFVLGFDVVVVFVRFLRVMVGPVSMVWKTRGRELPVCERVPSRAISKRM